MRDHEGSVGEAAPAVADDARSRDSTSASRLGY